MKTTPLLSIRILFLGFLWVSLCSPSPGQTEWAFDKLDRAALLEENEGVPASIAFLEEMLEEAKRSFGESHENFGHIASMLSSYYLLDNRHGKGERYLRMALENFRTSLGDDMSTADAALQLADLCKDQGRIREAEKYFEEAERIYRLHPGPPDGNLIYAAEQLAEIYQQQGKTREADEKSKEVDEMFDEVTNFEEELDQQVGDEEDYPLADPLTDQVKTKWKSWTIQEAIDAVSAIEKSDPHEQLRLRAEKTKEILIEHLVINPNNTVYRVKATVEDYLNANSMDWNDVESKDKQLGELRMGADYNKYFNFSWNSRIGRCEEHCAFFTKIMKSVGESNFKQLSSNSTIAGGHKFIVVDPGPDFIADMPWTWGPNAFVPDSWLRGSSLKPEQCWSSRFYFGEGLFSVSHSHDRGPARKNFWNYFAERAWEAGQGMQRGVDYYTRKAAPGGVSGAENCKKYAKIYNEMGPFELQGGTLLAKGIWNQLDQQGVKWSNKTQPPRVPPKPDQICGDQTSGDIPQNPCFTSERMQKVVTQFPYYDMIPDATKEKWQKEPGWLTSDDFGFEESGKSPILLGGMEFKGQANVKIHFNWLLSNVKRDPNSHGYKHWREVFDQKLNSPGKNTKVGMMGKDSYMISSCTAGARDFYNNNSPYESHAELHVYSTCDPSYVKVHLWLQTDIPTHGSRDKPEVLKALKDRAEQLAMQYMQVFMSSAEPAQ